MLDLLRRRRFLAAAARERGLLVGLKNDLDQIPDLVHDFDFAVNEQRFEYDECAECARECSTHDHVCCQRCAQACRECEQACQ